MMKLTLAGAEQEERSRNGQDEEGPRRGFYSTGNLFRVLMVTEKGLIKIISWDLDTYKEFVHVQ